MRNTVPIDYEHVQLVKIEGTRPPHSGKIFVKNYFSMKCIIQKNWFGNIFTIDNETISLNLNQAAPEGVSNVNLIMQET